eukprot:14347745-Alexandrium_andersonii.AAC.1
MSLGAALGDPLELLDSGDKSSPDSELSALAGPFRRGRMHGILQLKPREAPLPAYEAACKPNAYLSTQYVLSFLMKEPKVPPTHSESY